MTLFSAQEWSDRYIQALGELGEEGLEIVATHSHRKSDKPRISALGDCARKTFYEAVGAPETDPVDPISNWAQMLGTAGQSIVTAVLVRMGYEVWDVEKTVGLLPQNTLCEEHGGFGAPLCWITPDGEHTDDPDYLIPGHIDGKISGLDLGERVLTLDVKLRNTFGMYGTNYNPGMAPLGTKGGGLPAADVGVYLQLSTYDLAEGTDGCMVLLAPFDMSASRIAAYSKKAHDNDTRVPPAYRLIFDKDERAHEVGLARGKTIAAAVKLANQGTKLKVQRERDPTSHKLCNYCSRKSLCLAEGNEFDIAVPPIPAEWAVSNFTYQDDTVKELVGAAG